MSEKKTYRLYAMLITPEAIELAGKERFSRVTANYALVYTDKVIENKGVREITQEESYRLSNDEQAWLLACNMVVITENTAENEAEFIKDISAKLEQVEEALKEERRKVSTEV